MDNLRDYDYNTMSDYTFIQLENYVKLENYLPDKVSAQNRMTGFLCEWTTLLHEYGQIKNKKTGEENNDEKSIKNFIANNAYFSFEWENYLDNRNLTETELSEYLNSMNKIVEKVDLKKEKFMNVEKYFNLLYNHASAENKNNKKLYDFGEKFLKAKSANVKFKS
jgi:hypothetical protein